MSTLRINNIEAQSVPASPTIDEKVKVTNSSGDILVNIDGKTSGITTIGINTTDGNIKFDANSNVLITGILTATTLAGNFTPDSLEIGSNIKLGNAGVITATSFVGSGANLTSIPAANITGTLPAISGANLTNLPAQATIANNADDRVITGGSGVNLNGEANLTFETSTTGGTLTVAGTSEYQLKLKDSNTSGNGAETALAFTDSGNTIQGFVGYNYWGDGNLDIQNNNSGGNVCINTGGGNERVVIDSVGAITVQSALAGNTALAYLRNTRTRASGNKYGIEFRDSVNEANANIVIQQNSSGNNAAEMKFYVNGGTGGNGLENGNHILRLKQNKDVEIPDGNLVIGTSGHGIDFSATANAPLSGASMSNELLDDYEEGSFTPSGFCDGGSVTNQSSKYTKIGKCVFIYLYVSSINIPNTACQWKLYGLPFTVSGSHYPALAVGYSGSANLPAEIRFLCRANTNWIYSHSTAGTAAYVTNQGMRAYIQGQELLVTGYYFTDS